MFTRVKHCVLDAPGQLRKERRRTIGIRQRVLDRKCSEVVAAHVIEDHHVEWRRRRPLLVEPSHVEARWMRAPVHALMQRVVLNAWPVV
jgi:hypothetical protein